MQRCFLALVPPLDIAKTVEARLAPLKSALADYPIRWLPVENYHITLHFFGQLTDEIRAAVMARIDAVIPHLSTFTIRLGRIHAFPNSHHPFSLTPYVRPTRKLEHMVQHLRDSWHDLDVPMDKRPWRAHLTVAKLKPPHKKLAFDDPLFQQTIQWPVDSIELLQSQMDETGSHYTRVMTWDLRDP